MHQSRTRRALRLGALVATAALVASAAPATAGGWHHRPIDYAFTVMGTSDVHGNILNWDYFTNAEYTDRALNDVGLAKISTLVDQVRADRGERNTLLIDNGDLIQGTPLDYYFAKVDPITEGATHPLATAMNAMGYDSVTLGNHEFNYGLPMLREFGRELDAPLLGANVRSERTGRPAFQPYTIETVRVRGAAPLKVGVLGLTTPGSAIWDKANVEGVLEFRGMVEEAAYWVPRMKRAGADVVIVAAHTGADTSSSYGDALPYPENAGVLIAEQVPGIDAILLGHAHQEIAERVVTNLTTGEEVVLTEPLRWGMRLSVIDLDLTYARGRWSVADVSSSLLSTTDVEPDPEIVGLVADSHQQVVDYVNSVIGQSTEAMSAATARYEDAAALDFISYVQALEVKSGLTGTDADLPVLSIAAPFNRAAAIPAGDISLRDVAGLYIYDNTLLGIRFTGAEVKAYLEKSAEYFKAVPGPGTYVPDDVTNAPTATAPTGTPDYNYDVMFGLDAALTYDIDLTAPVGSRIVGLAYGGVPVADDQQFVVAINNYRQSGGGGFPGVTTAPIVYNELLEIRQLLIDWVSAEGTVDPALFASGNPDWRLVAGTEPLIIAE